MTTATVTLTDFLLARIAEDEAMTLLAPPLPLAGGLQLMRAMIGAHDDTGSHDGPVVGITVGRARLLAECEAKRKVVLRAHYYDGAAVAMENAWAHTLRDLASVYSDHEDYREEWQP